MSSSLETARMVGLQSSVSKVRYFAITSSFLLDKECSEFLSHSTDVHPSLKLWNNSKTCVWLMMSFQDAVLIPS